jgi:thiamine biosynthesis lipoprotein
VNALCQCRPLLGTYVEITIRGDAPDEDLLTRSLSAFEEIERIQSLLSFHDPLSELTRINRDAHKRSVEISPDTERVLAFALELCRVSGGAFDPSVAPELMRLGLLPEHGKPPTEPGNWQSIHLTATSLAFSRPLLLDLGGIAKGYAVDRALAVIGPDYDATVNAGGDLAMSCWEARTVEIRTPGSGGRSTVRVPMERSSIATSADYYLDHGHAIIDPQTRRPFAGKLSASVFAPTCMVADALTKVAVLMQDPAPVLRHFGAAGIIIDLEGRQHRL